jgi:hypothetical protein
MNLEDIIKMARQHGKPVQEQNAEVEYLFTLEGINALLAAEREACAKVAKETVCDMHLGTGIKIYGTKAAAAIRARGNT